MTKPTLKSGSTGDSVLEWQKIIGVEPDGSFGPVTVSATKDFQKKHKLVPDGVVGPLTWAVGIPGSPTSAPQKSPSASTDAWAFNVSKHAAPDMPMVERQYALSVARGEGFYGKGWKGEGVGSNNWGAVQGTGSAGSFQTTDHHEDGAAYTGTFKRYATPEEGFLDMSRILLKPNVKAALKKGDIKAAVYTQRANGYFELKPELYLQAVQRNYNQLRTNLEWPELLRVGGKTAWGGIVAGAAALGGAVVLGLRFFRKSR